MKNQIDYSKTTSLETWSGDKVWMSGYVLRTISKFINGVSEDQLVPIQVFFDPQTGRILDNTLPPEIRHEYSLNEPVNNNQESQQQPITWDSPTPDISQQESWGAQSNNEENTTSETNNSPQDSSIPIWGKF